MSLFTKGFNQINLVLSLRITAIIVQIALILFVNLGLNYQLPWLPLVLVVCVELLFTLVSFYYYRQDRVAGEHGLLVQIIADIIFLSILLYFSGGATNAFVSLLLLPIAISAVTLSLSHLFLVSMLAIGSYSFQLWLLPMHVMHGNMEGHFIGMWINFLLSAIVVALIVGKMARTGRDKDLAIASFREEQLKQEKVISLGVASAQVTHQLATPISTVCLLAEDLKDEYPNETLVDELQTELTRCTDSLTQFRQMVFDIKEQNQYLLAAIDLVKEIKDYVALNHPEITLTETYRLLERDILVKADASLVPAIFNIVNNAIRATKDNGSNNIEITLGASQSELSIIIRDFGRGFNVNELAELGVKPIASRQGLGMAVLLSHASLERLGGKLLLTNHADVGAIATINLPEVKNE